MAKHNTPKHRITKHEMKEDRFVTSMMQGADYARENVQNVVVLVLVFLVLVAGVVIVKSYFGKRKESAQNMLGIAQIAYQTGDFAEARDSLVELEKRYPKSDAASIGAYMLGHIYYSSAKPDSAGTYWQKFIESEYQDEDMILSTKAGLAGVLSDHGKFAEAARELEDLCINHPDYFNRQDFIYKTAMNYRAAGDTGKTKEFLKKFIEEFPESPNINQAKVFLAQIEAT